MERLTLEQAKAIAQPLADEYDLEIDWSDPQSAARTLDAAAGGAFDVAFSRACRTVANALHAHQAHLDFEAGKAAGVASGRSPCRIVLRHRLGDIHAEIDGSNGTRWGCGKSLDEAVGSVVRNQQNALGIRIVLPGEEGR